MIGRQVSFWDGFLAGVMLVSGRVLHVQNSACFPSSFAGRVSTFSFSWLLLEPQTKCHWAISSRPNRPSNGPHCLRTGTTTFGGPISHEPLPQEIVALGNCGNGANAMFLRLYTKAAKHEELSGVRRCSPLLMAGSSSNHKYVVMV